MNNNINNNSNTNQNTSRNNNSSVDDYHNTVRLRNGKQDIYISISLIRAVIHKLKWKKEFNSSRK
jgi:hypothetical protein